MKPTPPSTWSVASHARRALRPASALTTSSNRGGRGRIQGRPRPTSRPRWRRCRSRLWRAGGGPLGSDRSADRTARDWWRAPPRGPVRLRRRRASRARERDGPDAANCQGRCRHCPRPRGRRAEPGSSIRLRVRSSGSTSEAPMRIRQPVTSPSTT